MRLSASARSTSVVFAGFGGGALGDRIRASGSKAVFTADVTFRKGKDVALKGIVDQALGAGNARRREGRRLEPTAAPPPWSAGRDLTWEDFLAAAKGQSGGHVEMESNEPAFILATSGTTAKPKLAVHTHGGFQVHIASMARWCFGLKPTDVWWATSDIGWIVGHSYIVYAPLLAGCTTLAYEGAIDHPDPETPWRIAEEFGVTGIFTSPTAVRLLMRYGEAPPRATTSPRSSASFCAGEVLNAAGLGVAAEGGLRRTACRSSTTCGRPRPAGRSSATRTASALLPIKPGLGRRSRCPASTPRS